QDRTSTTVENPWEPNSAFCIVNRLRTWPRPITFARFNRAGCVCLFCHAGVRACSGTRCLYSFPPTCIDRTESYRHPGIAGFPAGTHAYTVAEPFPRLNTTARAVQAPADNPR